jgi:D-glycero-D-manno-heptose 1,7-bisphosphate phosphatase
VSAWAIYLDRDGVINALAPDPASGLPESPFRPEDVRLLPGAVEGLRALRSLGVPLVAISNQPAAAKGKATLAELETVHEAVHAALDAASVPLDSYRYCFHHPDGSGEFGRRCDCRKPEPGLILEAAADLSRDDLASSWLIGDSDVDIEAGRRAGCRTILVEHAASAHRRAGRSQPDERASDLPDAAAIIMRRVDRVR